MILTEQEQGKIFVKYFKANACLLKLLSNQINYMLLLVHFS